MSKILQLYKETDILVKLALNLRKRLEDLIITENVEEVLDNKQDKYLKDNRSGAIICVYAEQDILDKLDNNRINEIGDIIICEMFGNVPQVFKDRINIREYEVHDLTSSCNSIKFYTNIKFSTYADMMNSRGFININKYLELLWIYEAYNPNIINKTTLFYAIDLSRGEIEGLGPNNYIKQKEEKYRKKMDKVKSLSIIET